MVIPFLIMDATRPDKPGNFRRTFGIRHGVFACIELLLVMGAFASQGSNNTDSASPEDVVRAFYTFHFAHDMAFTADGISARAPWLAPDLAALCRSYMASPSSPDEVPTIDGDPFTDSQEYPTSFKIGKTVRKKDRADVLVEFAGEGGPQRSVHVLLKNIKGAWRLSDIRYESGPSFRALLATMQ